MAYHDPYLKTLKLEGDLHATLGVSGDGSVYETNTARTIGPADMATISQAISMKRIADFLERNEERILKSPGAQLMFNAAVTAARMETESK